MPKWPWIERAFCFDFPVSKWPDLLERVRGTPARVEDRVRDLPRDVLTRRPDAVGWSIQQNIGHLIDLGYIPIRRIEQILAGEKMLIAADMSNKRSNAADRDNFGISELLNKFRSERMRLVQLFESLNDVDWGRSAAHPRLKQPMRIVDIAYFDAEHDDYHLGRIGDLIRGFKQ